MNPTGIQTNNGYIVNEEGKIIAWVNPRNENIKDIETLQRQINELEKRFKELEIKQTMPERLQSAAEMPQINVNTRRVEQEGKRARDAIIEAFEKGFSK